MLINRIIGLVLVAIISTISFGQKLKEYDIRYAQNDMAKNCGEYLSIYNRLPNEVRYSLNLENDEIYFYFRSREYFDLLFDKKTDGIAVDIINRDQFACGKKNKINHDWAYRGYLMPPVYKEEIINGLIENERGSVYFKYGDVPTGFDPMNIECNLIILQKNYLCDYRSNYNLDYSNWSLLELGLYRDSLSAETREQKFKEVSKTLNFVIPFKKNQTNFNESNIRPLYDSLELTDYDITEIWIKAYSSVEGSFEKNKKLQEGRAQSLVEALQKYQTPQIESHVFARENWVDFMHAIEGTPYEYLKRKSKKEVKELLSKDKPMLEALDYSLNQHRKGLIKVKLHKKLSTEENDPVALKELFDYSIAEKNIEEALYLQEVIFDKIRNHKFADEFLEKLEVPKSSYFGPLLNNFNVFAYQQHDGNLYNNISDFEKLLEIIPENPKIKYNIAALKILAWREGELYTNAEEIEGLIKELEGFEIPSNLIHRLKINYWIILTEYLDLAHDFSAKNDLIREVYNLYLDIEMSDYDRLSLSKYLCHYSQFQLARAVLKPRVEAIDVEEDLIFYYLGLTIANPQMTKKSNYRTFILNATDKNTKRFCDLFLPKAQGGVTFQLLDNLFLKRTYCESCL